MIDPADLVAEHYTDALGHECVVSEATRRAFIALLSDDGASAIAPPVRVVCAGQMPTVDVTVPAADWERDVDWTLQPPSGEPTAGRLALREAEVVGYVHTANGTIDTRRLTFPFVLAEGDYRLTLAVAGTGSAALDLLVCPPQCFLPADRRPRWGIAIQLYALRSRRNWGIGDYGDLRAVCALAARSGATLVGVNPLHALHRSDPQACSPYAPASRRFLNWLAIDVSAVPEVSALPVRRYLSRQKSRIEALRAAPLIDYLKVARLKDAALRRCFDALTGARAEAFEAYVEAAGPPLRRFAVYEVLVARHGRALDAWPAEFRDPADPAVAAFAEDRAREVEFGMYLQWCAAEQLETVAAAARRDGVALYRDIAVGVESNSADVWGQSGYVHGATVGAPPDALNTQGQDWGLPPFSPAALQRTAYAPFTEMLADNMRNAGAVRIDHAMSLMRLFWIPRGGKAADGTYVTYPLEDLVAVLARESSRAHCIVIGEDLGTVADGFRERMAAADVLSYRILLFERKATGAFLRPDEYPELALAATGTHDLPPLLGWLAGDDIALHERIGLLDASLAAAERTTRALEVAQLEAALRAAGELGPAPTLEDVALAAYRFLGRSPALFVMLQLEDAAGETTPVNIPGTFAQYPNWRRKLGADLEEIGDNARFARFAAALRELRPLA